MASDISNEERIFEAARLLKDDAARDAVLRQHLGLVYHVAQQLARARANDVELDDLVSAGTLGLIDAFEHFDASRGLAFSTFAAPRIRGAMLDELRRLDTVGSGIWTPVRHSRGLRGAP